MASSFLVSSSTPKIVNAGSSDDLKFKIRLQSLLSSVSLFSTGTQCIIKKHLTEVNKQQGLFSVSDNIHCRKLQFQGLLQCFHIYFTANDIYLTGLAVV